MGLDHPAADVQHRPLGLDDHPGRLAHLLRVRARHGAVAGQVEVLRPLERGLRLQRVLGDVDEHRAGAAGAGHVERVAQRFHQENLVFAFAYNAIGIPIAAGVLYPSFGVTLIVVLLAEGVLAVVRRGSEPASADTSG